MAYLKKRENMKKLTKSLESYLLAIFKLSKENKKVTVKDVSKLLNHNVQSTTEAIQRLHKHGFIEYLPYKGIKPLIPMNKYIKTYFEREKTIKDFLKKFLLVEDDNLQKVFENIQFGIDDYLYERFNSFLNFLEFCPCSHPNWIEGFNSYLKNGEMTDKCADCIEKAAKGENKTDCKGCKAK